MRELGRPQLSQQLIATEFNEVLIVRCERRSHLQKTVNGFTGTHEIGGLFSNRFHGIGAPLDRDEVE